jgi:bifunctional enzyme CysN/CysC
LELYVDAPLAACIARDPKGLYKRALAGDIAEFSGVSAPYEVPTQPDLRLSTTEREAEALADQVIAWLEQAGKIPRR